jgi:hypothetical protein
MNDQILSCLLYKPNAGPQTAPSDKPDYNEDEEGLTFVTIAATVGVSRVRGLAAAKLATRRPGR